MIQALGTVQLLEIIYFWVIFGLSWTFAKEIIVNFSGLPQITKMSQFSFFIPAQQTYISNQVTLTIQNVMNSILETRLDP